MNHIEEWFDPIFHENHKRIFRIVHQALVTHGISETEELTKDLVQKTFLTLLVRREDILDHPNIPAWLVSTAEKIVKDELRRSKYKMEIPFPEEFDPAGREEGENVQFILPSGLTKEERELLTLLAEGYKPKDIAGMKGITPEACRMRVKRAKDHFLLLALEKDKLKK